MMANEFSRWLGNASVGQTTEDVRDNHRDWSLVMWLQLVLVLGFELIFLHVEIKVDLFVPLELHNKEWIPSLALAKRGIEANGDECMNVVWLRQNHEFLHRVILNFVVVGFASQPEGLLVHVNIETTTIAELAIISTVSQGAITEV